MRETACELIKKKKKKKKSISSVQWLCQAEKKRPALWVQVMVMEKLGED